MSAPHPSPHSAAGRMKIYLAVFAALLAGTAVTVLMNSIHFDRMAVTIAVALFIASVKASLVAGFFMHLISEKKAVYAIVVATGVFCAALLALTVYSRDSLPKGTVYFGEAAPPAGTMGERAR